MKTVVLITNNDKIKSKWQFDLVMAAISYEFDLSIVFMCEGCQQISTNKAWKCLSMYGIDQVYFYHKFQTVIDNALFEIKSLTSTQLKRLVNNAEILI
jgi:hypothetical protein